MTVTVCEHCAEPMGAPHRLLPGDCILGHADHAERFIGFACRRHYGWIDATLVQIEELFALRGSVLIPGPSGGERTGTRTGSPAPGRIDVMALTDRRARMPTEDDDIPDVPGQLGSWLLLVIDELDIAVTGVVGLDDLSVAVRMLRRHRKWIVQQAWLDDYVSELAALHRAVARAVGDSMWPRPIGKCPNDGSPLHNTIGVDEVTCRRCKSTWSGPHLARLRLIFEQAEAKAEA